MPEPVSPALDYRLKEALQKMPSTGRGFVEADATLTGYRVSLGHRLAKNLTLTGYGASTWKGQREAGVRLRKTW